MADDRTLREVGEHPFLRSLCQRLRARHGNESGASARSQLLVPPGDDCAVLAPRDAPLAVTTDALIEGVHFRNEWLAPDEIGRRAVATAVSDLAAMAATPAWTLVAVAAPPGLGARTLDEILDGCAAASEQAGAQMVGGNLTSSPVLAVTVTALGHVLGRCLTRSGAAPGDTLLVTGTLGGAAAAVAAWSAGSSADLELRARFAAPQARVRAGIVLAREGAHAAIDVSDGFLADLGHLCAASDVGAIVDRARLPRLPAVAALDAAGNDFAACGGEDYELLVACPEALVGRLDELSRVAEVDLTAVGHCVAAAQGIVLRDADGAPHRRRADGFDHFARRP